MNEELKFTEINNTSQPPLQSLPPQASKRRIIILIGAVALLLAVGLFFTIKTSFTLNKIFSVRKSSYLSLVKNDLIKDPNRLNILILGLRGEGDPNGGLLTDTMMIMSIKKDTGQTALISVPRDIYIQVPSEDSKNPRYERINFSYAWGRERAGIAGGLIYSKAAISDVTGLYLDYAIAVDFAAFEKIINILGGINIYLNKPFEEASQFNQEFLINLPAGDNYLDGQTALYYVRSRFSTSDFDRAKRQQEVLLAVKNKALSTGILLNPVKLYNLLSALGNHIRTDMRLDDVKNLANLYPHLDFKNTKRLVLDTSSQGLLYSSYNEKGSYILLPVGDNFDKLYEATKNIFSR